MSQDARVEKLPVLLVSMVLLFSAIGAIALMDIGSEFGPSSPEEVVEEGASNENPIAHGTRSPTFTTRSVLVELFTGTWCQFCPGAEGACDRLADEFPRTMLSILEYHIGDTYEVTGNTDRRAYYGNPAYPAAYFDGMNAQVGGSQNPDDPATYNAYRQKIDMRVPEPSPITITLNGSLSPTSGSVTASITAIDKIPPSLFQNLKARFVIYEDHNYSVYTTYEYRLRFTVVENLPEESITLTQEQNLQFTKTFTPDPAWELDKIGACVFVQSDNGTREIIQSTSLNLSALDSKVDLAIKPLDISFSDSTPYETQVIMISATVHNVGTTTTSPLNVMVSFFDGDPEMGGTQIGTDQNAGVIGAGGSSMVQVSWDTTGQAGLNEIVVAVDYMYNIPEPENENNNRAPRLITVDPGGPPQIDYIRIKEVAGNGGSWIGDTSYLLGGTDTFWAGGYNISSGWIQDVAAAWSSDTPSVGDVGPGPSSSTTLNTYNPGTCKITADYGGLLNTTGVLTISSYSTLKQGWNLISLPLIQSDPSRTKVLESIDGDYDAVQFYDVTDASDPWKHYKQGKPYGNDLSQIDETMAAWVHINQPGDTIFLHNGVPATVDQSIDLYPGWNLVGYPSLTIYNRTDGLNTLIFGSQVDSIWSYDAATQTWNEMGSSDYFEPGTGYWVHATTTCVWDVPI